ncbi:MAG: hypothetical protein LBI19_01815 [Oscillospiraceae bacterium]|jgi:hypothetical protein|nr:hypothetical protein [Oscillospiraceae bacterium]
MFTMKAFRYVAQFWFSILMVLVIVPAFSLIYAGTIPFPGVLRDMAFGFVVANAVGLLIPIQPLADKFAGLFRAKNGTFSYILLTTLIFSSIYVVFFGFLYTALAIGFPPYYLQTVMKGIPLGFAVSYVLSVGINPIAMKLSFWTCSKDGSR